MQFIRRLAVSLAAGTAIALSTLVIAAQTTSQRGAAGSATALPFDGMQYRLVGPFRGGRATGVSGTSSDPNVYYFGASAGGVWKTTDGGRTWKPLWDKFPEASPSIGAVAVAPSDPNIVYVGTGEANIRGNVVTGNGIYKSTDAGKTWAFIGLRESQAVGRMVVDPKDPNLVYVAALGHPFGDNGERGIFRTRDGGKSWERVLYVDDKTGGIDIQIDPTNPKVLYAGMWQVFRKPWTFESGGPGSGLYKSEDGGTTWKRLSGHGLPEGLLGRIGVAPTSNPKRIYALIEAEKGGLYRTDDGGASWKLINGDNAYKQRAWYYTNVFADPKDPDKVFVMNTDAFKSTDAGVKFKKMATYHGDNHQLWINPDHPNYMVNSNDGGADVSVNGGETWTEEMNQPTAQFYHIATDNLTPYHLYGSQQDNTSVVIASGNVRGPIGIESFHSAGGGESGYIVPDPKDPSVVIANGYSGDVTRYDDKTGEIVQIGPWTHEIMGWAPKDLQHRPQWTEPLAFSPHDPNVLYNADEVLFRSTDNGRSWTVISPDLTRNDKSKQQAAGGPITKDNTGVEIYDTIFSVVESPVQKGLIWVGTDDGLIQLTRDGGAHWENVTPKAMPEWGTVDMVEADPHKAGTAYIAVDRHRLDDLKPYAFKTEDFGKTWTAITAGLPSDAYVHVVRADPARAGLLYAGTENGVFVSFDDGARWQPFQINLPRVPVHDLAVHAGDLAVATHGRAFWVLDDLSPVRQWSSAIPAEPMHLFAPRATQRVRYAGRGDSTSTSTGTNPPAGAIIYYSLKTGAEIGKTPEDRKADAEKTAKPGADETKPDAGKADPKRVKLEILDGSGKVIRTYPSAPASTAKVTPAKPQPGTPDEDDEDSRGGKAAQLPAKAGLNRFVWDLRYEAPVKVPKSTLWRSTLGGPVAIPGHYKVRLTVDGKTEVQPFDIVPNPALSVSQADLKKQFDLNLAVNDELSLVQDAVLEIRALHRQLADIRTGTGKAAGSAQLIEAATALDRKADAIEEELIQKKAIANEDPLNFPIRLNNMLASLATSVGRGDVAPTAQEYTEWADLKARATADLAKWEQLKAGDLAQFNAMLKHDRRSAVTIAANIERDLERAQYGDEVAVGEDDEDSN